MGHGSRAAILRAELQHILEFLTIQEALPSYTIVNNVRGKRPRMMQEFTNCNSLQYFDSSMVHRVLEKLDLLLTGIRSLSAC